MKSLSLLLSLLIAVNPALAANSSTRKLEGALIKNGAATLTLPTSTDTIVGRATTDTLANKTLTAPTTDVLTMQEQGSAPSSPAAGFQRLYPKTDGKFYRKNSSGIETEVGSGAGGSAGINMLAASNPNAETGSTANWTPTGSGVFTTTSTASNVGSGTYAFSFDAAGSGDRIDSTTVAIPAGLYGQNCLLFTRYKGFDSNVTFSVTDGTNVLYSQALTAAASGYTPLIVTFPCPSSGSLAMRVAASGNAAIGYWDDAYVGENYLFQNSQPTTEWTSWTPTGSWVSNATYTGRWRRVGDVAEYQVTVTTSGAPTATQLNINLPSGHVIDTSKMPATANNPPLGFGYATDTATLNYNVRVSYASSTSVTVSSVSASGASATLNGLNSTTPFTFGSTDSVDVLFRAPIVGFGPQAAVRADNADFDWTSFAPTGSWSTNTTYTGRYRRVGDSAEIEVSVSTSGAPTSTGLTINMPSGLVIDTTKLSSNLLPFGQTDIDDASVSSYQGTVRYASTTTVYPFVGNASGSYVSNNSVTQAVPFTFGSGDSVNLKFVAPIVGWTNNQRAPLLVGSVTSNTSGLERVERARVAHSSSATTVCSASPCTIWSQSGTWLTGCTRSGTGNYSCTIATGIFSAPPTCSIMAMGAVGFAVGHTGGTTATNLIVNAGYNTTVADAYLDILCMGPR